MSSSTRNRCRSGRRRVAVWTGLLLVLLVALPLVGGTDARAQQGVAVAPAGTADGRTRLVGEGPATGDGQAAPSFSVTVDGTPRPVTATPLLSEPTATA